MSEKIEAETTAVIATGPSARADAVLYNPDNDFRSLALDSAYVAQGFRLVDKSDLIGVPFVVKRIVFRPGMPKSGEKTPGDYVSVECIVADTELLESYPTKTMLPVPMTVYGNEPVVFNDSSTGIRRYLVNGLQIVGLIDVGIASRKDENPLDKEFQRWAKGGDRALDGFQGFDFDHKKAIVVATRGLRRSQYKWQDASGHEHPAETYYFA